MDFSFNTKYIHYQNKLHVLNKKKFNILKVNK